MAKRGSPDGVARSVFKNYTATSTTTTNTNNNNSNDNANNDSTHNTAFSFLPGPRALNSCMHRLSLDTY